MIRFLLEHSIKQYEFCYKEYTHIDEDVKELESLLRSGGYDSSNGNHDRYCLVGIEILEDKNDSTIN